MVFGIAGEAMQKIATWGDNMDGAYDGINGVDYIYVAPTSSQPLEQLSKLRDAAKASLLDAFNTRALARYDMRHPKPSEDDVREALADARRTEFQREWATLIGLYKILVNEDAPRQMVARAYHELNTKLFVHRLGISADALKRMDPLVALERIAPRYLLRDATLPEGPFGPMVTAESSEKLVDLMYNMNADPRLKAMMDGAGYLVKSSAAYRRDLGAYQRAVDTAMDDDQYDGR